MLSNEQIEANQIRFEDLLNCIHRDGSRIPELINKLRNSDFYYAPASSKFHGAYAGGLCEHCLNVYDNANIVALQKFTEVVENPETGENENRCSISQESIIICALLHDLSKMNYYVTDIKNKKIYSDDGKRQDEMGKFDWVSVPGYRVRDTEERFLFGNHEQTAEFMVRNFIPLTVEESVAILHHMGGLSDDSAKDNITAVFNKYPLAITLHLADMMATYIDEVIR